MNNDPLPSLLYRLNQNTLALTSAIEEISLWIEQQGTEGIAETVTAYLKVVTDNSNVIADSLAELAVKDARY